MMDLNRALQMLFRMLFWPLVQLGIDFAAKGGKPDSDLTPEERQNAQAARSLAQRARKAARLIRRLGR